VAPGDQIPSGVRQLIAERIESVTQLEVLLLVRAAPDKAWSVDEVARGLVTRPDAASGFLRHLEARSLVERVDADEGERYRYAAGKAERDVDELARCYATRRTSIINLIFGPRSSDPATSLADAFRLRRPR
jgi:hypothetical protein